MTVQNLPTQWTYPQKYSETSKPCPPSPQLCLVEGHESQVEAGEEARQAEQDAEKDDAQPNGQKGSVNLDLNGKLYLVYLPESQGYHLSVQSMYLNINFFSRSILSVLMRVTCQAQVFSLNDPGSMDHFPLYVVSFFGILPFKMPAIWLKWLRETKF